VIVVGVVSFHLDAFLLPGDDDVVDVSINVDDVVEIHSGEVIEVARLMLVLFWYALPMHGMLGVLELAPLLLDVVFIFDLHGFHGVESIYKYLMIGEGPRCIWV
jgi:hypothetical protein